MSIKLIVRIMEEVDVPRPWAAVLLAMADHADDEGRNCYPSVDKIAWKANYKPRNVVNILRAMESSGVITKVREATRHRPAEYRINVTKAPKKPSFTAWRAANGRGAVSEQDESRGAISEPRGAISELEGCNFETDGVPKMHPNRYIEPTEPPGEPYLDAPEPEIDPRKELIAVWSKRCNEGRHPTNYGEAMKHAKTLLDAGFDEEETEMMIDWLQSQPWVHSVTLRFMVNQADAFRSSKRNGSSKATPSRNGDVPQDGTLFRKLAEELRENGL